MMTEDKMKLTKVEDEGDEEDNEYVDKDDKTKIKTDDRSKGEDDK